MYIDSIIIIFTGIDEITYLKVLNNSERQTLGKSLTFRQDYTGHKHCRGHRLTHEKLMYIARSKEKNVLM